MEKTNTGKKKAVSPGGGSGPARKYAGKGSCLMLFYRNFFTRVLCVSSRAKSPNVVAVLLFVFRVQHLAKEFGLLQTMPGVNKIAIVCLLFEVGPDISKYPAVQYWAF